MKSKIIGSRFVLAVKDLAQSVDFYKNQLGFHTMWDGDGWYFLIRDSTQIMLGECPDDVSPSEIGCHSYFAYLDVQNIDELYQEYRSKHVEILSHIEDKPWRQREFSIRTIDGHRMTFGAEISKS